MVSFGFSYVTIDVIACWNAICHNYADIILFEVESAYFPSTYNFPVAYIDKRIYLRPLCYQRFAVNLQKQETSWVIVRYYLGVCHVNRTIAISTVFRDYLIRSIPIHFLKHNECSSCLGITLFFCKTLSHKFFKRSKKIIKCGEGITCFTKPIAQLKRIYGCINCCLRCFFGFLTAANTIRNSHKECVVALMRANGILTMRIIVLVFGKIKFHFVLSVRFLACDTGEPGD